MVRFTNDQNKVVILLESGTYGNPSGLGQWPGLVQSHAFTESQNVIPIRNLGQATRNVSTQENGPLDIEGTMSLFPQDWRFLGYALGSITITSGTAQAGNYRYIMSEQDSNTRASAFTSGTFNPYISFSVEESRTGAIANRNSVRTFKGAIINIHTINITQSEPIVVDLGLIAQTGSFSSGTSTAVTAETNRPYLWNDATWQVPGGTNVTPVKSWSFEINNNFTGPHYINGVRTIDVPYPANRDYSVSVTQDMDSSTIGSFYDIYYLGGSQFNAVMDINYSNNTIGSHRATITMSGCRITEMEEPADVGGISELAYTVVPTSVSAIAHERVSRFLPF